MKDPIDETLELSPIEEDDNNLPVLSGTPVKKNDKDMENVDNDYRYTRENLYSIIEQGQRALENIMDVADQSQHPRAYEVVATLLKTMVEANKDLLGLAQTKQELLKNQLKEEDGEKSTVNNNLFVGSTTDLQKMLEDLKNHKND